MNLYENLIKDLENNENKLVITRLKGSTGNLDKDFERIVVNPKDSMINSMVQNNMAEPHIKEAVQEVLRTGKPKTVRGNEGRLTIIEPFYPKERLIILGGGHIALPLTEFGARAGFSVTVADDRPSFANKARFPLAERVICESFDKVLEQLKLTAYDYIVIITRGHRYDTECLRHILSRTETIYAGMIGSKRRVAAVKALLKEEGFDKERIDRVCTPIGLSIGAVTPEEISISIMAQIIRRKRLDQNENYAGNRSDLDIKVLELLAASKEEPMSIVTIIDTKGSVPRGPGAKMIVYPAGQIAGSIGGGCSEAEVIHDAVKIIGTKSFMLRTIDMTGDAAEAEGMVCGGIMEVLIEDKV